MDLNEYGTKSKSGPNDAPDGPPIQFMLGEAMVAQKKMKKLGVD